MGEPNVQRVYSTTPAINAADTLVRLLSTPGGLYLRQLFTAAERGERLVIAPGRIDEVNAALAAWLIDELNALADEAAG